MAAGLAVLIAGIGSAGVTTAVTRSGAPAPASYGAPAPGPSAAVAASQALRAGEPVRVRIAAIGVDAEMGRLGLNGDGTLEVPPYDRAGWYQGGPKPGEIGSSVIAAHVDSRTGPAVFYRLKRLVPGDSVTVDYDDGSSVDFVVKESDSYPKAEFPSERVYGATAVPTLRLITCGGSFDRRSGNYQENLVVSAVAV